MEDYRGKFQDLLRELFQFDCADLDFGLYRLLHLRRQEVEAFLTEQLPRQVDEAFRAEVAGDRATLEKEIQELAAKIRQDVAEDALTPTGDVNPTYANIKSVQQYQTLRERLAAVGATEARQAEVFNHLYNFFSRYYEDGDFIPRRRYGAGETYAVPYDGQEVFFHWATRDMYYVKTAETFKDYAFTVETLSGSFRVRFVLTEASVPKDNVKGDRRFFFPRPDLASYEQSAREFRLPFEYRPPTEQEAQKYGTNAKAQEAISAEAVEAILRAIPDETLRAALAEDQRTEQQRAEDQPELPLVLKRLRHFARRQTSDFFIHKNLRSFLRRELEFYAKDQVLNLADIEGDLDAKRRMIRVLRRLGEQVIDFLAQIEDAQKRLFEKRKFVTETQYCITVGNIPESFYADIAADDAQWIEWKELFHIDEEAKNLFNANAKSRKDQRVAFLKAHPTLVLDTRHFDQEFKDRLLVSFDDLDEMTDGLLIHSENFQALSLLLEKYRETVKCIYIDPPYNAKTSEILYKNDYKHSSWMTMMNDRISASRLLTMPDGVFVCAIDENEQERLGFLLNIIFPDSDKTCVSVVHNPRGIQGAGFSYTNEFAYFVHRGGLALGMRQLEDSKSKPLMKTGSESERETAKSCFYPICVKDGRVVRVGDVPDDDWHPKRAVTKLSSGETEVWPISSSDNKERKWRYARQSIEGVIDQLEVREGRNDWPVIYLGKEAESYRTVWTGPEFNAAEYGSTLLKNILDAEFSFPKSIWTVVHSLKVSNVTATDIVLDYFAGSGTTGHAVITLNREDGGGRRFILGEMGEYFDTVLLPRIKKVTFSPEWKEGKPVRQATAEEAKRSPRIVKYIRLESYEDALHNVAADGTQEQAAEREKATKEVVGGDQYRLHYLVRLPLEAAETVLSVGQLEHPFDYTLEILTDQGPRRQGVDLVETFSYLYGLAVRKLTTWVNAQDKTSRDPNGRVYRIVRATDREKRKRILVLWRDMTDLDPAKERAFLEAQIKAEGQAHDEVLINGDTATPAVASLDGRFKRLMMAEEDQAS